MVAEAQSYYFQLNSPKYFTNGDGFNDTWNVTAMPNPGNSKLYIYDMANS
jgi:gliding motility-associated-like protein